MEDELINKIYNNLTKHLQTDFSKFESNQLTMNLPIIPIKDLLYMCEKVEEIFKNEETVIEISSPVIIIGDLHGHFLDLLRILNKYGLPLEFSYIFLGDLVDRGEFSLEVVSLVFCLKILFPNKVFLIRGNHEFDFLCSRCGFMAELSNCYPNSTIYNNFIASFSFIPLAAIINKTILCVHGGIGPSIFSLRQLKTIGRPILDFGDHVLDPLLWSDPTDQTPFFEPSTRGTGYFFGDRALNDFLLQNNLKMLIRGHECVNEGIQSIFNNKLITVFSASNYCGLIPNNSGILHINNNSETIFDSFPPLFYLKREDVLFTEINSFDYKKDKPGITSSASFASVPFLKPKNVFKLTKNNKSSTQHSSLPKIHSPLIKRSSSKNGLDTFNNFISNSPLIY